MTSSILFTWHHKKWLHICVKITDFREFGKPPTFDETQRRGNFYTTAMLSYSTLGTVAYALTAVLDMPQCRQFNKEHNTHEICALGPVWLPFQISNMMMLVVDAIQFFSTIGIFYSAISGAFLVFNAANLTITHIDNFKRLFLLIFEEEDDITRSKMFGVCINYHNHILRIGNILCQLTKVTQGHISLTSAVCIGCIGNQILKEHSIRSFMHLIGFGVGLFVLCHSGQKMIDESESMRQAVYSAQWYISKPKLIKDVKFVITRCEDPIYLSALPLGYLSYPLYLMIVKTSYSYVTLLSQST